MRRAFAFAVILATLVATFSGATEASRDQALFIIGYDPAHADVAKLAILAAGGSIQRSSPELGFSVASTNARETFETILGLNPIIDYVETDDPTALHAGQWNGGQWNGAQWNGGQWNGGQWNAGQWNAGQWNMDGWSDAQRTAFDWTIDAFFANDQDFDYDTATSDPGLVWQWGSWSTRATGAWSTSEGAGGAHLCVLDSGVAYDHADLAPNMWTDALGSHGINVIDPTATPYDDAGHGTHIAGIAAGRVGNAYGIAGVANVKIMVAKVLDSTGHGLEDQLAIGIAWCATQGADVAVMALGVTEPGPSLDRALQYATDRDVLLLASAGNAGPCADCVGYPASDPRVLAVSATDGTNVRAAFSNAGPPIALAAPGVEILGPFLGDGFVFGSGTSQAVALGAGVASLVRDAAPERTAQEAASILTSTARDLGPAGRDATFGYGLVDAEAALAAATSNADRSQ